MHDDMNEYTAPPSPLPFFLFFFHLSVVVFFLPKTVDTEYYSYVQDASGPDATVVVNPGIQPHDTLYNIGDAYEAVNPGMGGQVVIVS